MKKLTQFLKEKFKQFYLHQNEKLNEMLLDECLDEIFPDGKILTADMKSLSREDKNVNEYKRKYLPFHTQDEEWLAKYLEQVFYRLRSNKILKRLEKGKLNNNLKKISLPEIQKYVATSELFAQRRDEYEQNVVTNYINSFNNFNENDFYYDAEHKSKFWYEGKELHQGDDCMDVISYRKHILQATDYLGIDNRNAQVTLEKNPDLWRNKVWRNDMLCRLLHAVMSKNEVSSLPNLDRKKLRSNGYSEYFRLAWIEDQLFSVYKVRDEHFYYNATTPEIKDLIDELDLATPSMKISRKKIANLEKSILHLCKEYVKEYDSCQNMVEQFVNNCYTK